MRLSEENLTQSLLEFLRKSPSPFHAVHEIAEKLRPQGFAELKERDAWTLKAGGKYFVTRNDSAIVAFQKGRGAAAETGFRIVGSHTDSPCLKPKPNPEVKSVGYWKIGVEVYGSPLLSTWFDRDLSIAGRVSYVGDFPGVKTALVDLQHPVAIVPNLAIHLNRDANDNRTIHRQNELPPVLGLWRDEFDLRKLLQQVLATRVKDLGEVQDFDLCFYDTQPAQRIGLWREFIAGARLDNLLSCWVATNAFVDAAADYHPVLLCLDHEEVGSESTAGAQGNFVESILRRVAGGDHEDFARACARSLFVSTDNAHGIHPNYPEKHEPRHAPLLHDGPVIKINQNQRYATTGLTAARFESFCRAASVPCQRFVVRTDMACGTTIGPILASRTGIPTVDVGVPTFAMHSIRETAGTKDAFYLAQALAQCYGTAELWTD